MNTLSVASMVQGFAGGGLGAVAYVSPDQKPEVMARSLDSQRTLVCLRLAADAIERGDGIDAIRYAGEAWFRIVLFHRGDL